MDPRDSSLCGNCRFQSPPEEGICEGWWCAFYAKALVPTMDEPYPLKRCRACLEKGVPGHSP